MRSKLVALVALLALAPPAFAAESVAGRWKTQDGAAIVRIGRCASGAVCGVAERVLDPKAPINDINNPDAKLRTRPIVGSMILTGFHDGGDEWTGGEAYSPKVGRTFHARMKLLSDRRLRVTGCVLFICKSIYWTRVS